MTETHKNSGRCLCGAVTFTANQAGQQVGACHCAMCRRWGGGPFMEINCGADVVFDGEEDITVFSSSDWAERGFCRHCGSHLFYRLKESREHMMPVGLFEKDANLHFSQQVFIDEKPDYYDFSNPTETMTSDEIFAMFSPPES